MNPIQEQQSFTLKAIHDAHSNLKTPFARDCVEYALRNDHGIILVSEEQLPFYDETFQGNCLNSICPPNNRKICKIKIKDVFVLENNNDHSYVLCGNHCIELFAKKKLISNVTEETFHKINTLIKTTSVCPLCECSTIKSFHQACLKGTSKRLIVDPKIIRLKSQVGNEIVIARLIEEIHPLFKGNYFIRDMYFKLQRGKHPRLTEQITGQQIAALKRWRETYDVIIDNKKKLLSLKNNCIVRSIQYQTRAPTEKQMALLKMIIQDYDRLLPIDESMTNLKYNMYGYCYSK